MGLSWSDIKKDIGVAAPILGTVLGGPAGAVAGTLISSALGVKNDPDSVATALAADPTALEKLKEAELNSKVQLQQLIVQQEGQRLQFAQKDYETEVSDRNSARDLAAKQPGDFIRPTITIVLLVGAIVLAALVISGLASKTLNDATVAVTAGTIIGYWFNELKQVLAFYFGSTRDTSAQQKTITDFAVAPGSVTHDGGAAASSVNNAGTVVNNIQPKDDQ